MILKNKARKTIIAANLKEARSIADKTLGLLKKSNSRSMIFETRFGIHTFFMDKSIDVLILDSYYKVCRIKKGLKPNRIFIYNFRYPFVVELPLGLIDKSKTKLGDRLDIE